MVERFHRTLKATLTAHESTHWTQYLSVVLIALRSTVKQDISATPADSCKGRIMTRPDAYLCPLSLTRSAMFLFESMHITRHYNLAIKGHTPYSSAVPKISSCSSVTEHPGPPWTDLSRPSSCVTIRWPTTLMLCKQSTSSQHQN